MEVSAFPSLKRNSLTRKRLRRKWKREPISAHTHFISLVIALPLPRVYKFLPWSAGACYYPVMTSGQLCEETKSLTSLLPVTGFLDNAPCEKDILKKPLSVKKAAGQEWWCLLFYEGKNGVGGGLTPSVASAKHLQYAGSCPLPHSAGNCSTLGSERERKRSKIEIEEFSQVKEG